MPSPKPVRKTRSNPPTSQREMKPLPIREARRVLSDLANEAHFRNRIVPVTRRGKTIMAVIGLRDLLRLRRIDARSAARAA